MWDCVMDMEDIQVNTGHDLCHLCGKNKIIGRVFKKRIREHLDFMEVDAIGHSQANWKCIADEVHFVPAGCEFLTQFRSYHAATTVGRIAGDPNLHISITWCSLESRLSASSRRCVKPNPYGTRNEVILITLS